MRQEYTGCSRLLFSFSMMKHLLLPSALCLTLLTGCSWLQGVMEQDSMSSSSASSVDAMMEDEGMMESSAAMMEEEGDTMMEDDSAMSEDSMMEDDDSMVEASGTYTAYTDGVIGNGETSVLFFHASWCPKCRDADSFLTQLYSSDAPAVSVYKLDYDEELELRQRYGVVQQHTFVMIDGEGNALNSASFISNTQLEAMLES